MLLQLERIGRLLKELETLTMPDAEPVAAYRVQATAGDIKDPALLPEAGWQAFGADTAWGGDNAACWFETEVTVPARMQGACALFELRTEAKGWDATNPQFTVYVDGVLRQGFDVNHYRILLAEEAVAGQRFHVLLRALSGPNQPHLHLLGRLVQLDREAEAYYYDLLVPYQVASLLPEGDDQHIRIVQALTDSVNLLDLRKPGSAAYRASLAAAQASLTEALYAPCGREGAPRIHCVGHTHIDVAWLWTLAVTEDKAVRSFSTVLELMDRYPEYLFMSSQPQLYKYVQRNAPEVFERIRARVAEGRWETEGAMFVEADCNLTSGESLVRQILHGKRYFRDTFGKDNVILWLPDVFGYSAALPQIMHKSGIRYFMTTKISWNEFNKVPYDTFLWEGIDGTRILTHFSPSCDYKTGEERGSFKRSHFTTYNANINASQVMGAWQRYQQKDLNGEALMTFGYGDGGGGPTKEMLEAQRRFAKGMPGAPVTAMDTSRRFFEKLEAGVTGRKQLPAWVGELYLEYHRGTYTGMARNKRYNRKLEFAYLNAELLASMAERWCGAAYPQQALLAGWEVIERNQFHDILPGSSIRQVYEDSKAEYEGITADSARLLDEAGRAVAEGVAAQAGTLVAFNPTGYDADGAVTFAVPAGIAVPVVLADGRALPTQRTGAESAVFCGGQVPPKGYRALALADAAADASLAPRAGSIRIEGDAVETPYYRLSFNAQGQIATLYDKRAAREVLRPGQCANVLMTYEDKPHNHDAWDVNHYYMEKSWPVDTLISREVVEQGAVRTAIRFVWTYLDSTIAQTVLLYEHDPRIDFVTEVDWHEKQVFMKALFPVDVQASEATYEIQYGHVKRPTHYNTLWDFARFEVCHHKWLDLSEDGYGVSLLNDCKYGAHVHDGVIGLSLIKSATSPNEDADRERHTFTYALLPHQGGWREAGTLRAAYALNNPVRCHVKAAAGGTLPPVASLVRSANENLVVEVVKRAEDSDALIVRVYEAWQRRTSATLTFAAPLASAASCNLLEEEEAVLPCDGASLHFDIKPFEIKTFAVRMK